MIYHQLICYGAMALLLVNSLVVIASKKYRQKAGFKIHFGALAILYLDLFYCVATGVEQGYWLSAMLMAALALAFFESAKVLGNEILFYRWRKDHEKENDWEDSLINELKAKNLQIKLLQDENEQIIHTHREWLLNKKKEEEQKQERLEHNKTVEAGLPGVEVQHDTKEGFQFYALLIKGYEAERGVLLDRHIHNICEKMMAALDSDEQQLLLGIDNKLTQEAGRFYNLT